MKQTILITILGLALATPGFAQMGGGGDHGNGGGMGGGGDHGDMGGGGGMGGGGMMNGAGMLTVAEETLAELDGRLASARRLIVPAGAVIWLIANITIDGTPIAEYMVNFLNPFGLLLGLNGVILVAYIVAIPANEIVIPTVLMLTVLITGISGTGAGA